jgi:hypothetical protein
VSLTDLDKFATIVGVTSVSYFCSSSQVQMDSILDKRSPAAKHYKLFFDELPFIVERKLGVQVEFTELGSLPEITPSRAFRFALFI